MKAMILESLGRGKAASATPLRLVQHPEPALAPGEVLLRVTRCGVCHTELDEIEGRTPPAAVACHFGASGGGNSEEVVATSVKRPRGVSRSETTEVVTTVNVSVWHGSPPRAGIANIVYRVRKIFVPSSRRPDVTSTADMQNT